MPIIHCALCIELTPKLLRLLRGFVKFIEGDASTKSVPRLGHGTLGTHGTLLQSTFFRHYKVYRGEFIVERHLCPIGQLKKICHYALCIKLSIRHCVGGELGLLLVENVDISLD